MNMYKRWLLFLIVPLLMFAPTLEATTLPSAVATVSLTATVVESLTVSVSPGTLNFTNNNVNATPLVVTTTWNLASGAHTQLDVEAYFASATALVGTPSGSVPTSGVVMVTPGTGGTCNTSRVIGGTTYSNACGSGPVFNVPITSTNLSGSNSTNTTWQIGALMSAPPGTYTGTLNFQANAF
jgi:hypothetical protein